MSGLDRGLSGAHHLWHPQDAGVQRLSQGPGPLPRRRVEGTAWDAVYDEPAKPFLVIAPDNGTRALHRPRDLATRTSGGRARPRRPDDPRAARLDTDPGLKIDAALFEVPLHVVGEAIPVVIAAGYDRVARARIFPGRLARVSNGLVPGGAPSGAHRGGRRTRLGLLRHRGRDDPRPLR